jgi:hypothetical protein
MIKEFITLNILWLVVTLLFALVHYYIIERLNKKIIHGVSFVLSAVAGIFLCIKIYDSITFTIVAILYCGIQYWIVFNLLLNKFRNEPVLYVSTGSILDRLEASAKNPAMVLGLKLVVMVMCAFVILDL